MYSIRPKSPSWTPSYSVSIQGSPRVPPVEVLHDDPLVTKAENSDTKQASADEQAGKLSTEAEVELAPASPVVIIENQVEKSSDADLEVGERAEVEPALDTRTLDSLANIDQQAVPASTAHAPAVEELAHSPEGSNTVREAGAESSADMVPKSATEQNAEAPTVDISQVQTKDIDLELTLINFR